ncbi:MAG: HNH endonuclease [Desulfobacteraceae bacterium]|jgi:putative restriction endonuclease|nr:HNH endonuclease [Desulfobacteraceae bacterium]MDD3992373.1 HNH endonuclease [Desulfobacteraceae bacterium]
MPGNFEKYLDAFTRLRIDRNRKYWTAETCFGAPHKPFLLLSVMDLAAQGQITGNLIAPSQELVETFNGYWQLVMPSERTTSMAYPFFHLQSDGFWHLEPLPGRRVPKTATTPSMAWLRRNFAGARLDEDLFVFLLDPVFREQLRMVLVQKYFAKEVQPRVAEQGFVNFAAFVYARDLIANAAETPADFGKSEPPPQPIRDQGFRKAIVQLYEHRCALCGIRMLTDEGHTVVEAAHIVPWSKSHDDLPTNGLCLCRLCHWSFDEGLMGVGERYEVLVSRSVRSERNFLGHIQSLIGREIIRPADADYHPSQDNLAWHRQHVYG